jgi:hypothetical protein
MFIEVINYETSSYILPIISDPDNDAYEISVSLGDSFPFVKYIENE